MHKVPMSELSSRMDKFRRIMTEINPEWEFAVIISKINQYYFTGTMQDGILIIQKNEEPVYWVRRSYERALEESLLPIIKQMESFRDAAVSVGSLPDTVYMETEILTMAYYQRFQRYFPFKNVKSLDACISSIRAVKSEYELEQIEKAGKIHEKVLEKRVPELLETGMSELDLYTRFFTVMLEEGHHGVNRFGMFDTELGNGHICFGESSIYPTNFNGPGGGHGISAAVPILGSRERKLLKGDLIFIDAGCGVNGYHTDKTMTYMYGKKLPAYVIEVHQRCVEIQDELASMLKPGAVPSVIYRSVLNKLGQMEDITNEQQLHSGGFLKNFMGFGARRVKFLGHGTGLQIDEQPVIAEGFNEPLRENMVIALEPKKGIEGIGMVGIENSFKVTSEGGISITGKSKGLIPVYFN